MECTETSCEGGIRCCVNIQQYPGFYCKIVSQCYQQPIWQVIVIPSLLAFLAIALTAIIFYKLKGRKANKRLVTTYAYEQIRMKPKVDNRFLSATNIVTPNTFKKQQYQTQATPNNPITKSSIQSYN